MKTTIDKAGRVVIPVAIRERSGLQPGAALEIFADDVSVRLVRTAPAPALVRRHKRLVARPTVPARDLPTVNLSRLVEEERNRWPW